MISPIRETITYITSFLNAKDLDLTWNTNSKSGFERYNRFPLQTQILIHIEHNVNTVVILVQTYEFDITVLFPLQGK